MFHTPCTISSIFKFSDAVETSTLTHRSQLKAVVLGWRALNEQQNAPLPIGIIVRGENIRFQALWEQCSGVHNWDASFHR